MKTHRQRIVCAANRLPDGTIILGARHWDEFMHSAADAHMSNLNIDDDAAFCGNAEQGFIDQWGEFLNREQAWVIAEKNGQIIRQCSAPGTLFSENLY